MLIHLDPSLPSWIAAVLGALTLCVSVYGVRLQRRAARPISPAGVSIVLLDTQDADTKELILDIRSEAAYFLPRQLEKLEVIAPDPRAYLGP